MIPRDAKRRLLWHGILIFLLGLLAGAFAPWLTNPRMGVAAHVGGVLSGTFLILVGLIWEEIKLPVVDIRLTPVAPICCSSGRGARARACRRGLPAHVHRVPGALSDRGSVPGIPGEAAMAGRLSLSCLPGGAGVEDEARIVDVSRVLAPDVGDRGHDLPGHAEAAAALVPGHVVRDEHKERGQRSESPAPAGLQAV